MWCRFRKGCKRCHDYTICITRLLQHCKTTELRLTTVVTDSLKLVPLLSPRVYTLIYVCFEKRREIPLKGIVIIEEAPLTKARKLTLLSVLSLTHYSDVIMGAMASEITSLTIVYSTVYWGADQRKHQSSASLACARGIHRWPVNSPHTWPVTQKMFPFDDVIMHIFNKLQTHIPNQSLSTDHKIWKSSMEVCCFVVFRCRSIIPIPHRLTSVHIDCPSSFQAILKNICKPTWIIWES